MSKRLSSLSSVKAIKIIFSFPNKLSAEKVFSLEPLVRLRWTFYLFALISEIRKGFELWNYARVVCFYRLCSTTLKGNWVFATSISPSIYPYLIGSSIFFFSDRYEILEIFRTFKWMIESKRQDSPSVAVTQDSPSVTVTYFE